MDRLLDLLRDIAASIGLTPRRQVIAIDRLPSNFLR